MHEVFTDLALMKKKMYDDDACLVKKVFLYYDVYDNDTMID